MKETRDKNRRQALIFWFLAGLAAVAGALYILSRPVYNLQTFQFYADRGELLYHAVADKAVSYSMPLLSLLVSLAKYHLKFPPDLLAKTAEFLIFLPVFAIGALGGGSARGALYALAALAINIVYSGQEGEQIIYSLFLLVFLSAELERQERGGILSSAASGLAAGMTLLVRSPLFAFPPLAVAYQYFSLKPPFKKWLLLSALFLACAYLPLAPWARLNHNLFGRFIPLEEARSTCNLITGASGITFTIEGDARAYAGLSRTESPYPWAVKKILGNPFNYARAVLRRIWQVFLMFPLLFLLAGAGLALCRKKAEARFLAFFSSYFILLHCLLSIEERYFYPLRFVLALLAAGGAWELLVRASLMRNKAWRDRVTRPLLAALALVSAYCLAVVWHYPSAAAPGLIAVTRELKKYPGDPWLYKKKGEILLSLDLTAPGLEALGEACRLGRNRDLCWIVPALKGSPPPIPAGIETRYELLLIKTLRELQLGFYPEAGNSFTEAYTEWFSEKNGIKGNPYRSDLAQLQKIKDTNNTFWDSDIYAALSYFPQSARASIADRLSRLTPLTPRLKSVKLGTDTKEGGDYSLSLAYLEAAARPRYTDNIENVKLSGQGRALMHALACASARGRLALLLMTAKPSPGQAALFYLDAYDPSAAGENKTGGRVLFALAKFMKRPDEGSPELEAALRGAPAFLLAAARELAAENKEEASLLISAALRSPKATDATRAEAAILYQQLGEHSKCHGLISLLLKKNPEDPALNNDLGVSLMFLGREKEAEAAFLKAVNSRGSGFSPAMNLAAIYSRRGDRGKAARFYRIALNAPGLPGDERNRIEKELKTLD